ncbi:MAG: isoprenoid biosynthesis glyoxalase ElbB [Bdellovibrionota bacterium]
MKNKKVALILAGCGAKDGAEITEAVSLLVAFSQENYEVNMFAPNRPVHHVINHLNNEICANETRNILVESARIARGKIQPLEELDEKKFDILAFSGGFGVAKNNCDFAFKGEQAKLHNDIKNVLVQFVQSKKVVAALCIAPVLLALVAKELKLKQVLITLGSNENDASKIVRSWGIETKDKKVREACVDIDNKFVTAPAYMDDSATPADIFASATALVRGINELLT